MAPTYQASTELRRTIAERIDLLYWFLDVDDHLQALVLEADRDIAQIEQNGGAVPEELVAAWREECAGGEMSLGAQDAPTPAFFFEERVRVVKALRALHDAMRAAVDPASRADPWRYFDDVVGVDRRWITAAARRAHSVRFGGRRSVLPTVPPPDDAAVAPPVDGMGDAAVAPPVDGMGDAAVPPPVDGMDDAAVAPPVDGMGDAAVAPPVDGMGDAAVAPPVDGMGDAAVAPPVDGMDDAAVAPPVDGMDDAAVAPPVDGMDDAAVAPPVDGMGDAAVASPVDGMGDAAVASPVDGMGDAAVGLRSGPGDVMSGYLAALRYRTTVVRTALAPARVRDTKRALVVEALRELYEAARHVAKREWTESDEFRLAVAAYLEERYPQHGTKFLQRRGEDQNAASDRRRARQERAKSREADRVADLVLKTRNTPAELAESLALAGSLTPLSGEKLVALRHAIADVALYPTFFDVSSSLDAACTACECVLGDSGATWKRAARKGVQPDLLGRWISPGPERADGVPWGAVKGRAPGSD